MFNNDQSLYTNVPLNIGHCPSFSLSPKQSLLTKFVFLHKVSRQPHSINIYCVTYILWYLRKCCSHMKENRSFGEKI